MWAMVLVVVCVLWASLFAALCLSLGRKCWMVASHACGVALVHWKPDAWSLGLKIMHSPGSSSLWQWAVQPNPFSHCAGVLMQSFFASLFYTGICPSYTSGVHPRVSGSLLLVVLVEDDVCGRCSAFLRL